MRPEADYLDHATDGAAGDEVTLEINDGFVDKPFASATIHVLAAEGLIPIAE